MGMPSLSTSASTNAATFAFDEAISPSRAFQYLVESIQDDAEDKYEIVLESIREERLGGALAHLQHSNKDWSISFKEIKDGRCLVTDMNCPGAKNCLAQKWEAKKAEEAANEPVSPPEPPPKFVLRRTVDVLFLNPDVEIPDSQDDSEMDIDPPTPETVQNAVNFYSKGFDTDGA
ncbi:hypothetical protein FAVG1_06417 [Fusarium avenaceum]|nr:hypothetical protein FAVG1_06417 [Fusarium avenaceum]